MKEFWNQRYQEDGFAYGTEPNDFLVDHYATIPMGPVLCLADGEGRNGVFLARAGYAVTAIDQSETGLAKARGLAAQHQTALNTVVADLADCEIGKMQWSGIVSIFAHVPVVLRQQLHKKVVDGLRSGGVFLLEAYTPAHLDMPGIGGPPAAQRDLLMTLDTLRSELSGLDFEVAQEITRDIHEGTYHQGSSAVVQIVARKP